MAKFVIANRRAGRRSKSELEESRDSIDHAMRRLHSGFQIASDFETRDESASRVVQFAASPEEVAEISSELPSDVMVEPVILRWPTTHAPADFITENMQFAFAEDAGVGEKLKVRVTGGGRPLGECEVILYLRGVGGITSKLVKNTPSSGAVSFSYGAFFQPSALVAVPKGDYWPMVFRGPQASAAIECPPLPKKGPLGWWHEELGIETFSANRGKGVRVGVIDTGVSSHPCLSHVHDVGAVIQGTLDPEGGGDSNSHGSHVSGIIGARPRKNGQYGGVAPGCDLYSCRVFPKDDGANQGDIAEAIDLLSIDSQVDLINMSLAGDQASEIERDAIVAAFEAGTLCICAAGNENREVMFPAAFEETVAVSALGKLGWGPMGSIAASRLPHQSNRFGSYQLYLANFSCFGAEIDCSGPGVGYVSTVPPFDGGKMPFASMGGTSMATPAVCAAAAVILSENTEFLEMPRNEARSYLAKKLLIDSCVSLGLDSELEGRGVPFVG